MIARRRTAQGGLTLIEVTIGLAIVALVMGVAIVSVNSLTGAHLRSSAVEITGAIKYSYDRAIMEKRIQRIGFDLDKQVWWLEYTDDPYALTGQLARGDKGTPLDEEDDDEEPSIFDEDDDVEVRTALEGGRAASFVPDSESGAPRAIPSDIQIESVWTGHQEKPFTSGVAYLHFFRGGWTEPAQIVLTDGAGDYITLKVSPLTGRVRMYRKRLEDGRGETYDASEEGGRL